MSSTRLPPAIDLEIGASPRLACACAAAHAAAIAAVFLSGLAWPLRFVLAAVLLAFATWWIGARALALGPRAIVRFIWRPDGECEWRERRGRWRRGALLPGTLVAPGLVIVRLRAGRLSSRTLCLADDAVNAEALRRLRMRLVVSPPSAPPSVPRQLAAWFRRRWKGRLRRREATL